VRAAATDRVAARYDAVRALLDRAMSAGPGEAGLAPVATALLETEARTLDAARYGDWLALYAEDACLWVPAHPDDHPGLDQALAFDDKRRLRERARRMHDPQAWALVAPRPVTVRQLGPVAAWADGDGILAVAALTVTHVRRGPAHVLHGREIISLVPAAEGFLIAAKILVFPELALGAPHLGWLM